MSDLTAQEMNAGISRRALDTIRSNGNKRASTEIISAYRATSVIDTPMRKLEILETEDGTVILRNTEYTGRGCGVSVGLIHMASYTESQALSRALDRLEGASELTPEAFNRVKSRKNA